MNVKPKVTSGEMGQLDMLEQIRQGGMYEEFATEEDLFHERVSLY